ncbi:MAG: hypothetical protein EOP47_16625 [Sphingobacteriaceae bacterium]|nr:MAG: hypothetical protein EOP47_16625 [Sphingobacteriaceae bacterium]
MKIAILVLAFLSLSACKEQHDLRKHEVYRILNEIFRDDSTFLPIVCAQLTKLPVRGEWNKEFTDEDRSFIADQQELFKDFKIDSSELKFYSGKYKKFIPVKVISDCKGHNNIVYRLSFPFIAIDRTKVVLEVIEDCNCMLGGHGGKYLFIKEQNHWKRTKSYGYYISSYSSKDGKPTSAR